MLIKAKNLFIILLSNLSLLILFFILIQNTNNKSSVYFLKTKSIEIPISLIIGLGFITGSSLGSTLSILLKDE